MQIITKVADLRKAVAKAESENKTIALVPTMGALHAGHMSLIERARKDCLFVVVSIFVNPTQFNNKEDLEKYPRTVEADCEMLRKAGVDVAFIPTVEEIYPEEDTRVFDLGPIAEVMEGKMRPGHFNGVCQIVSKLLEMVNPHWAYFGEKDYQQVAVINKLADIIKFEGAIVPCPICREADGLAMSSRNVRLTPAQRKVAPQIYKELKQFAQNVANGEEIEQARQKVIEALNGINEMEVEYFEIADAETLQPYDPAKGENKELIACITVWLGDVRLIDNIKLPKKP